MSCSISKIGNVLFKAHQSKVGRAKISLAIFLITAVLAASAITAYGAIHNGLSGWEPLKFMGTVISRPISLNISSVLALIGISYTLVHPDTKPRTSSSPMPNPQSSTPDPVPVPALTSTSNRAQASAPTPTSSRAQASAPTPTSSRAQASAPTPTSNRALALTSIETSTLAPSPTPDPATSLGPVHSLSLPAATSASSTSSVSAFSSTRSSSSPSFSTSSLVVPATSLIPLNRDFITLLTEIKYKKGGVGPLYFELKDKQYMFSKTHDDREPYRLYLKDKTLHAKGLISLSITEDQYKKLNTYLTKQNEYSVYEGNLD